MSCLTRNIRHSALLLSLLPAFAIAQRPAPGMPPPPHECSAASEGPYRRAFGHPHLDEAQQDKLFTLRHEQEPQQRELHKQAEKARRALAELARSGQYSDAKAKQLADNLGQAEAGLALMRARYVSRVYEMLTPQQREEMRRPRCAPGRGDGPPGRGFGGRDHGPRGEEGPRGDGAAAGSRKQS